jgi:hypothetical protein
MLHRSATKVGAGELDMSSGCSCVVEEEKKGWETREDAEDGGEGRQEGRESRVAAV